MNAEAAQAEPESVRSLGPVSTDERIDSLDVLRGVGVLGILTINILLFALPWHTSIDIDLLGPLSNADWITWQASLVFVEGSQRAIFSMLFGAGVVLLTSRLVSSDRAEFATKIYYRRTLWLIAFGMVDAYLLLWFGDILFLYGVAGLILYFARDWTPRKTIIVAGVILVFLVLLRLGASALVDYKHQVYEDVQLQAQLQIDEDELEKIGELIGVVDPQEARVEIESRGSGYVSAFWGNAKLAFEMQTKSALLMSLWDALALMMIGMALFKWRVLDASRSIVFYTVMCVSGLALGWSVNAWEMFAVIEQGVQEGYYLWTYDIGRIATAMGYVGAVMLICKLQILSAVRSCLAAVGRMALTNYIMQSIICGVIFVVFGFFGKIGIAHLYLIVLGIWAVQLIYSPLWLSRFRYGPLEWLWRRLTYGKRTTQAISIR